MTSLLGDDCFEERLGDFFPRVGDEPLPLDFTDSVEDFVGLVTPFPDFGLDELERLALLFCF